MRVSQTITKDLFKDGPYRWEVKVPKRVGKGKVFLLAKADDPTQKTAWSGTLLLKPESEKTPAPPAIQVQDGNCDFIDLIAGVKYTLYIAPYDKSFATHTAAQGREVVAAPDTMTLYREINIIPRKQITPEIRCIDKETGAVVPNAVVRFSENGRTVGVVRSGPEGQFKVAPKTLLEGDYELRVTAPDYRTNTLALHVDDSVPVVVKLQHARTLIVELVDAHGKPYTAAKVIAGVTDSNGGINEQPASFDARGIARITGLLDEKVMVVCLADSGFVKPPDAAAHGGREHDQPVHGAAARVSSKMLAAAMVDISQSQSIKLTVERERRVKGRVLATQKGDQLVIVDKKTRIPLSFTGLQADGGYDTKIITCCAEAYIHRGRQLISLGAIAMGEREEAVFDFTVTDEAIKQAVDYKTMMGF